MDLQITFSREEGYERLRRRERWELRGIKNFAEDKNETLARGSKLEAGCNWEIMLGAKIKF